jgi:hypothetical protein
MWTSLRDFVVTAAHYCIGQRIVKRENKYWFHSSEHRAALAKYREWHRRFTHHRNDLDCRQKFDAARAEWMKVQKEAKAKAWKEFCQKAEKTENRKLCWSVWRKSIGSNSLPIASIAAAGQLPTTVEESLENLASGFASNMSAGIRDDDCKETTLIVENFMKSNKHADASSDLDLPFTEIEVDEARKSIGLDKAPGPDNLPAHFFRYGPPVLSAVLLLLYNWSWKYGVLPLEWRQANGIALYKGKGDRSLADNYRPVSMTVVCVKMMEKMVLWRLLPFLSASNVIAPQQAAFRQSFSTRDNLLSLLSAVYSALGTRKGVHVCFLDIKKAFDVVWHDGLLYKLFKIGIKGCAWRWLRSFLTDRQFRLVDSGRKSQYYPTTSGVPQGCVLSPLLFLLYINDIVRCVTPQCQIALFADDIALWYKVASISALQTTLSNITEWARRWHLQFSSKKSNVVFFSNSSANDQWSSVPLTLSDFQLEYSEHYCYLGLIFQRTGRWGEQAMSVTEKIRRSSYLIGRLCSFDSPPSALSIRSLVQSILYGRLGYSLAFWRPTKEALSKLQGLVANPIRICLGLPQHTNIRSVLAEVGLPELDIYRQYLQLRFLKHASSLPLNHPTRTLMEQKSESKSFYAQSIQREFEDVDRLWNGSSINDAKELKSLCLSKSMKNWQDSKKGGSLKAIRTQSAGTAFYLRFDPKPLACHRARLRFNLTRLNASMFKRGLVSTDKCTTCQDEVETREHFLLHCPRYAHTRFKYQQSLSAFDLRLDLATVLGEVSTPISNRRRREVLCITGKFVSELQSTREF